MRGFEELIPRLPDRPLRTEDREESYQKHRHYAEDDVLLIHEVFVHKRLRLVEFPFHERPAEGMQETLHEDDSSEPAVQEVEMLVGDAR